MKTFITLFTGGDGYGCGARAAGLRSTCGVEIDSEIADWAERNDPNLSVIRADVTEVDYPSLEVPYLLHASPQCQRASQATPKAIETEQDIAQARGITVALVALCPPVFTLENVWLYRRFQAFKNILHTLTALGYKADFWHLNAADYGIPQTRKRLILIARRDKYPMKPKPTHTASGGANGQLDLFGEESNTWLGWYEAIKDLIPTLPDSEFAPWQLERLRKYDTRLFAQGGYDGDIVSRAQTSPAFTITANHNQDGIKALLIDGQSSGMRESITTRENSMPSFTVATGDTPRALLVDGQNGGLREQITCREDNRPAFTLTNMYKGAPRAFVIDCQNGSFREDGQRDLTIRLANEPIFTVMSGYNKPARAQLATGRVVKLTPRALARLQSVPDSYLLPENNRLACKMNGNMVPPLLAQRIVESLDS